MAVDRKKTSLYLDRRLVMTAKMLAATSGRHEYEVIEDALRQYLQARRQEAGHNLLRLFDEIAERHEREGIPPLSDDEAMRLANDELHAMRAERDRQT